LHVIPYLVLEIDSFSVEPTRESFLKYRYW
jgi:hypothetical protein